MLTPCQQVVDYADTFFVNIFANKKNFETVFACSYGAQMEFFDKKKCRKSLDSVPLTCIDIAILNNCTV